MACEEEEEVLRDATESDLPAIVAIYNAAIPGRLATADTAPVSVESRQQWFADHNPQTRPLWILERDGQLVAWIGLSSFYGRPAYGATAEVSIYVAPTHHKQGIGSYLLEKMMAQCAHYGVDTLLAFVFGHNQASLRMCRAAGFEQWGLLPHVAKLDGIKRDLVIMGRKVP